MRLTLWKSIPFLALVAAICLMTAAACGGNAEEKGAADTATPPPATESGPPASRIVPGEIETAARKLLADDLEVDGEGFRLDSSGSVQWSDASLGCPKEGMMYAQVITPGYQLVFAIEGTSYAVHTNSDGSHMVVCGEGQ